MLPAYNVESFSDFTNPDIDASMRAALAKAKSEIGKTYPLVIGGEVIERKDVFEMRRNSAGCQVREGAGPLTT